MRMALDDPEMADDFSQPSEPSPYTVEGFRKEINRLTIKVRTLREFILLAKALSREEKVISVLRDAMKVK